MYPFIIFLIIKTITAKLTKAKNAIMPVPALNMCSIIEQLETKTNSIESNTIFGILLFITYWFAIIKLTPFEVIVVTSKVDYKLIYFVTQFSKNVI